MSIIISYEQNGLYVLSWSFRRAGQYFPMQRTPCEQQDQVQEGGRAALHLVLPPWGRQPREGLHPMRSYSIKAESKDNDLCSPLKVQSGLWDVCFPLWKLELWPMHWMSTRSCQDVPQTLKGNAAAFILSYFALTTLRCNSLTQAQ